MLIEECAGACDRVNMVVTATHNMKDSREERMARYKEERRRALAAQFGPRDPAPPASPRTTRASRLRTLANSENLISKTPKEDEEVSGGEASAGKKERDKSGKRKSYLNRSHTSEPVPAPGENGQRRRSGIIPTSVSSICAAAVKKSATNQTTSPIPKSSQLVRNQLISTQKHERGSTPDSDVSSSSSRFGKRAGSLSSPVNLSPSHKNVRGKQSGGSASSSNPASPAKTPHSILKKHEEQTSPLHHSINLPVSILKRKTSNDENSARCASPVRFSPSVVERKGRGILKKHRSLDDPQLESHSLQDSGDEKNCKNGDRRRCSLEEVSRRSPEPQGILKRKASREETEPAPPEPPPSILKRRSSPLVSSDSLSPEPILKRKEDAPTEPRPILKKKSSSEEEEHSVRPILKESPARRPAAEIRPILKQQTEDSVLMRPRSGRMYSGENRLSLDAGLLRRLEEPRTGRPLSVAERVHHMESYASLDGILPRSSSPALRMDEDECSKGLERSGSVSEKASIFAQLEQKEKLAAEAAKARRLQKGLRQRGKVEGGRFNTQPVTIIEVEQAKRNNDPSSGDEPSKLTLAERVALFARKEEPEKIVTTAPPPPRRLSQQAPLLVEGLMKNLTEKSGARVPLLPRKPSTSSTSSDSDGDQDDRLSPNREFAQAMGEVRTLRRCATQPLSTPDETDDSKPLTIAERLAALKKNGHSNWMKRIARTSPEEEILSTKPPLGGSRFSEKLEQLETATEGWKARVVAPDSHQFSVAGKMGPVSTPPPALGGANRTPAPQVFTPSHGIGSMSTPSVPDSLASLMKRSISVPEGKENEPAGDAPVIQVPAPYDEDFSSFFLSPDLKRLTTIGEVEVADLEHISSQTSHLLVVKRNVKVSRKHRSANPLKALAQRSDLKTEYVEIKSGVADREIRRMNIEKLSKNSNLAVEALAGLASKEDIGGVALKKADTPPAALAQWSHPLLLRVKGRRHPITSVVKPVYTSVNQGDSFILVTKDQVFHWVGEFCSLTEKSRGSEIAAEIATRKDLGCTGASNVITLESSGNSERHKEFWRLLALPDLLMSSYKGESAGHPDEDSVYEVAMTETYLVYRLAGDRLVPVEQYWGRIPKVALLNPTQVLVFDFRSEVYLWSGKNADMTEKRIGFKLAQDLYKQGYNSSWHPTGINWLDEEMSKNERPDWSILCRVTQHMEPVIFREKFFDWPDFTRVIQAKTLPQSDRQVDGSVEVRPCDVEEMVSWKLPEPDLILENTHLGRGKSFYDEETRRLFEMKTLNVKIWHIHDYSRTALEPSSFGHFHRGDSYIVRWHYSVTVTGRELSGEPSRHGSTGRERVAYITWHGSEAPALEQGAAALHTVELDSEAAAQLHVVEGREPPVFLSLLPGPLVVHSLTRAHDRQEECRLYIITGEEEPRLDEVEVSVRSLRSRASLWLIYPLAGESYLWHGSATTVREQAVATVNKLASSPPPELSQVSTIQVVEIEEGEEPSKFLGGCNKINREVYGSRLEERQEIERQMRLYHLSSLTGELTARGIPSLRTRSGGAITPFPYLQEDLYSVSQPGVFIVESSSRVWVWVGWWREEEEEQGSRGVRFAAEKRAADTVALGFARAVGSAPERVVTVAAGLEPPAFISLFPLWTVSQEAKAANLEEGWMNGEMRNTQAELSALMRETYPLETLVNPPLPAGVDPTRLELYLSSNDFKEVFKMDKEDFSELPAWKQVKLKKSAGLF